MSNPSKLTPRRHPSASTPPAIEYDGADAPVLIRLPDLSVSHAAPTDSSVAAPSADRQDASRKGRRRRRIDRSHSASRRSRELPTVSLDAIPKSRIVIAALVLAVAGITYFLVPTRRDSEEDSSRIADPWAMEMPSDDQLTDVQVVIPNNSNVDLWPENSEAAGHQDPYSISPSQSIPSEQALAQDRQADRQGSSPAWPDTPQGIPLLAPSGHAAPVQPDDFDEVAPAVGEVSSGVPARRVSNQTSQPGWPDDSDSTSGTASEVPAQTAYPEGASPRTGRRQVDAATRGSSVSPQSGSRLNGIRFPHPATRDEPRTKLR